jgi:hypothetical protein
LGVPMTLRHRDLDRHNLRSFFVLTTLA